MILRVKDYLLVSIIVEKTVYRTGQKSSYVLLKSVS